MSEIPVTSHAAVPRGQTSVSQRHPVLSHGRLLRDVLRRRARRRPRPRTDADLAIERYLRQLDSNVRCSVSRGRYLRRAAGEKRLPRRDLRAGGGSAEGQGCRAPRSRPGGLAWHPGRRRAPRCTRSGVHDVGDLRTRSGHDIRRRATSRRRSSRSQKSRAGSSTRRRRARQFSINSVRQISRASTWSGDPPPSPLPARSFGI